MNDKYKEDIEARWQLLVWRTVIAICGVTFALSWIFYGVHRVEKNIVRRHYMLENIYNQMGIQIITLVVCFFKIKD
ncbi:GGDEF domain-containing protein, partial [Coprococcus eutactus]|nr:GGDEF domain-containing protein [Coprococcus eutactus]